MRVWLVDEREDSLPSLQGLLQQLAAENGQDLQVLGMGPYRPGLPQELRNCQLDLLVLHAPAWPEGPELLDLLEAGSGLIVAATPDQAPRFLTLAELYPVWLLSAQPDREALGLALRGARAALHRHRHWKSEIARLQQRLADRILIERAKGILVQRLGIHEEEAYNRLRVLSRRQRRHLRDVAQSLLDTQFLLLPEVNGVQDRKGDEEPTRALPPAGIPSNEMDQTL
jgi:hypothetical protein